MAVPSHPSHLSAVHTATNIPLHHRATTISQDTNTPDINLERDVIPASSADASTLFGMETGEIEEEESSGLLNARGSSYPLIAGSSISRKKQQEEDEFSDSRFKVNISTILISALLFLLVLAWFDFIQSAFYSTLSPEFTLDDVPPAVKLWYAIMITFFILILIYLVYYYSRDYIR